MNIWFVHHYAIPPTEAGGTRHFTFARWLVANGHTVHIAASSLRFQGQREIREFGRGWEQLESVDGVNFVWIRTARYRGNNASRLVNMASFALRVLRSRRLRAAGRPDVVLGSSPQPFAALAGYFLARRHDSAFVYEIRDLWPETLVELGHSSRWNPVVVIFGAIERFLLKRARSIITLLPASQEYLVRHGARREAIVCVPNGTDLSMAGPAVPPVRRNHCLFMYAGAVGVANGLDTVVRAAARLNREGAPVRIRLVGEGSERNRLQALALELGASNVEFRPSVPKRQVYAALAEADAFLMVLADSPVFRWGVSPNKLFDYMAMARPVLFAVSTPVDLVREAAAGISVPAGDSDALADAMLRIAALSWEERWEMGKRGRRFVEDRNDVAQLAERFGAVLTSNGTLSDGVGEA